MYLIDTNICVAVLRRRSRNAASRFMEAGVDSLGISSVTAAELYYGAERSLWPEDEYRRVAELLLTVDTLPFGTSEAIAYGLVRNHLQRIGQVIGSFDMLLAGHALALGATLVTNNMREFSRIPGLPVEDWTR